jgi:hypothetical protein
VRFRHDAGVKEMATQNLYDNDFYAWTQHQAKLLYSQQWDQIDLPNLIEEIES